MASFPFFRFPYNNYYYHYYPPYNLNNRNVTYNKENLSNNLENTSNNQEDLQHMELVTENSDRFNEHRKEHKKIPPKHNSFANINFNNLLTSNLEEPIIEILGISLYLDDISIIGLLFFLYTEGVQDEILFITLILLLLT